MLPQRSKLRLVAGLVAAPVFLALSIAATQELRTRAREAVEAATRSEAGARLGQVRTGLAATAMAAGSRGMAAAALPQLRALLSTLRAPEASLPLLRTLEDAFASESWWEPFRREFAGVGLSLAPGRLVMAVGIARDPFDVSQLIERAESTGSATGFTAVGETPALATADRIPVPGRERPAVLVLVRLLDQTALAGLLPRPGDAIAIEQGGRRLLAVGSAAGQAAFAAAAQPGRLRVAREPLDALTLAVATDTGAVAAAAQTGVPPVAVVVIGCALALAALWFGLARGSGRAREPPRAEAPAPARPGTQLGVGGGLTASAEAIRVDDKVSPHAETEWMVSPGNETVLGRVGRYTLIDKLGEGGMAQVYTAVVHGAEGFQRKFVVKRLRAELASNKMAVSQFIDEAKLGASLVHSNIIPVFDFGKVGDEYFMALEYILGRDLGRLVDRSLAAGRGPLPAAIVNYAVGETLKALDYAHSRCGEDGRPLGLVHRDVSPSNVLVSRRGEVKLFDFGIVKAEGRVTKTEHGVVKGNVSFMSPEQARGQATDARSDLFSLGLVLFYCLTGRTLYEGETTYDLLMKAACGPTAAEWALIDALSAGHAALLHTVLQFEPAGRYATAAAFAAGMTGLPQASGQEAATFLQDLVGGDLEQEESRLGRANPSDPDLAVADKRPRSNGANG